MTPPLWQKMRRTKEPLDESERGEWKMWLKTQHPDKEDHGIWSYQFMANRWGNNGNSDRLYFLGSKITTEGDCSHEIKRHLLFRRKVMTNLNSILKSRDFTLPTEVHLVKAIYGFSSSHVWIWKLDYKESLALKNWRFWTVTLEKTLESHLNSKEIQPINPKGNQSWILIGRIDAEAEVPILWQPDSFIKTLMLGMIEGRRIRGQ